MTREDFLNLYPIQVKDFKKVFSWIDYNNIEIYVEDVFENSYFSGDFIREHAYDEFRIQCFSVDIDEDNDVSDLNLTLYLIEGVK